MDGQKNSLNSDNKLQITASVLRSFIDIFYVLHIIFQFRTGFIAPSSRVFGRGVLVKDSIVNCLYFPRLYRIYPLYKEVTRTSSIITETTWVGVAFNLFLYMLFSHMFGASWYLLARQDRCWRKACGTNQTCILSLYCGDNSVENNLYLNVHCLLNDTTPFDFGIYLDALKYGVVESSDFPSKLFYCLWWGLRSLSSLGQNLETSMFVGEILFAVSISIFGLVLFSLLIGNMQTYLQSNTVRLEEMRVNRRYAEQWMSHRLLPDPLKQRIRRYEQYKWQETRGVDEHNLICNLPKDLRRDIKRLFESTHEDEGDKGNSEYVLDEYKQLFKAARDGVCGYLEKNPEVIAEVVPADITLGNLVRRRRQRA